MSWRGWNLHSQSSVSSWKFRTLKCFCFSAAWRNCVAHGGTCWAGGSSSLPLEKWGPGWCPSQGRCSAYYIFCFLLLKNIAEAEELGRSNFIFIWSVDSILSTPKTSSEYSNLFMHSSSKVNRCGGLTPAGSSALLSCSLAAPTAG